MDGVTPFPSGEVMPPRSPLPQPVQDLRHCHRDPQAPGWQRPQRVLWQRAAAFLPAGLTTGALGLAFADWLTPGGIWWLEWVLLGLVLITFFWIALTAATALLGLACHLMRRRRTVPRGIAPLRVALVVPIYNEDVAEVFGNACAMMSALHDSESRHRFQLFVLSDTQDAATAAEEEHTFAAMRGVLPPDAAVWYRRRARNADRKQGNIAQWLTGWGGDHDAMVVLDADSLMSPEALTRLADEMAADPAAGLIQTAPMLIGADTVFGRVQQFAAAVYGRLLSEGLAGWTGQEGNYWGHNAILRTRAFAACAGLPRMPTLRRKRRGELILSHDFVEAGLLRRAGWGVLFLPSIGGSYEEPPATLIDYALRDRRWCHGNLQHLRLLGARGFHALSRFHLFHGAMSYLLAPAWFGLLVIWALLGNGPDSVISYFSAENPLYPVWPEMSRISSFLILLFMYGMLLAPKVMGVLALGLNGVPVARFGGRAQFALSFVTEVVLSILFAPIMMVQQLVAVLRSVAGIRPIWSPQARKGGHYGFLTVLGFHALETLSGAGLLGGMMLGVISPWLLPIAVSLALAVLLSMLSGLRLSQCWGLSRLMATPEMLSPPPILRLARDHRLLFGAPRQAAIAAE